MKKADAQKKLRTLVDSIQKNYGTDVSMSLFTDKGQVKSVAIAAIDGPKEKEAKQAVRAWTKKHRIKLTKQPQIPPPFTKLTRKKVNKLKSIFRPERARKNPDPPACPTCGLEYKDLKTGLDFQAVKDMLWVVDDNPEYWRYKRRPTVLGLWYEIKRGMWGDHIGMCKEGKLLTENEYLDYLDDFGEY